MKSKIQIISGGQSGVDRAALAFALQFRLPISGYCPKGRLAEDGPIDIRYPIIETKDINYETRTQLNILKSDASLILYDCKMDLGTKLTLEICKDLNKLHLVIDIDKNETIDLQEWISKNHIYSLNIAGPRESNSPGIFKKVCELLARLLFP